MKIINLAITIILVISIPISVICLANNLTTRMPDLYQYELKATGVLSDLYVEKTEDEMGQFFSQFMMGKTSEFQMEYQYGDNKDLLFTVAEQKTMVKLRNVSNGILFTGLVALIFAIASYVLLYNQNLKMLIRKTFTRAAILFAALVATIGVLSLIHPLMESLYAFFFNYEIKSFLTLPVLISRDFFIHSIQATVGISVIIMCITWYFTWKITKPRRIFGASR